MSAVLNHPAQTDVGARLAFQKQLQAVTNKIHATNNIDEIMLEVSADVCALFNADRLTIYSMGEDKTVANTPSGDNPEPKAVTLRTQFSF